jgi:hypothetical protein
MNISAENVHVLPPLPVFPCSHFQKKMCTKKVNQNYEWIEDVKMHAHAKFRDEKSFVQEETERTKIILLIGVGCEFCINSAPNPINI